jgi:hypothetical protein
MTPARHRPHARPWRWILVAVAVLALASVGFVLLSRYDEGRPPSGTATTVAAATSPSSSLPACLPKITDAGFSVTGHVVHYGVIARSDCPQATFNNVVSVRVLDAAGNPIDGHHDNLPELLVLLPGQEVGGAGSFYMINVATVSRVDASFTASSAAPVSAFAAWPTSVRVADLNVGKPDSVGRTTVTGRIVTEPAGATLCSPYTSLILRDAAGKIIYGMSGVPRGTLVSFDLAMPGTADTGKTTVYVALGRGAVSLDQAAAAACRT